MFELLQSYLKKATCSGLFWVTMLHCPLFVFLTDVSCGSVVGFVLAPAMFAPTVTFAGAAREGALLSAGAPGLPVPGELLQPAREARQGGGGKGGTRKARA